MTAIIPQVRVTCEVDEYGNPQPEMRFTMPRQANWRQCNAAVHAVAAMVELATPRGAKWCVQSRFGELWMAVYLELADCSTEETAAGIETLRKVAAEVNKG